MSLHPRLSAVAISALVCTAVYFGTNLIVGSWAALESKDYSWQGFAWVGELWLGFPGVAVFGFIVFGVVIAAAGVPLDMLLRFIGWRSSLAYAAVGTVVGVAIGVAFGLLIPPMPGSSDDPRPPTEWDWIKHFVSLGVLFGALGSLAAVVYRQIARD